MNVFKSVLSDDRVSILLYGEVSDEGDEGCVSSRQFVDELNYLESVYPHIEIHINSVGGEVYPGIAIFNAIRRCKSDVTIYIDGIAASIAGVIALCGRRVEMSRYARIMLHNVSGGCYGNKEDLRNMIRELESLEDTIGEIIADRTHRDKEEVKAAYFDGKDHWITAAEAYSMGMADNIYDVEETVPEGSTSDDIYRIFTNRLKPFRQQPQNQIEMKLEDFKKIPRFASCSDESAAVAALTETASLADRAEDLEAENKQLKEQLEQEQAARVTAAVDEAVKDGRIGADQKDVYTNLLKKDWENGMAAMKALRPKRLLKNELGKQGGEGTEKAWEKRQAEIKNRYSHR